MIDYVSLGFRGLMENEGALALPQPEFGERGYDSAPGPGSQYFQGWGRGWSRKAGVLVPSTPARESSGLAFLEDGVVTAGQL